MDETLLLKETLTDLGYGEVVMESLGNTESGFTLVELMIVIILLGILAAWAVPSFSGLLSDMAIRKGASTITTSFEQAKAKLGKGGTLTIDPTARSITVAKNSDVIYETTLEDRIELSINAPVTYTVDAQGKVLAPGITSINVCDNKHSGETARVITISGGTTGATSSSSGILC